MKARIIETGEEITIIGISKEWGTAQYYGSDGVYRQRTFEDKEIEILDTTPPIDWEQRRCEIAKEVLASSFSTPMEGTSILSYVRSCVQVADILIEELKGGAE
jgi:ribonuclease III